MLNFLNGRGDNIISFTPIDYSPTLKKNWANFRFRQPFIIVDFLYHPNASWWFDHHPTAFVDEKWQKTFTNRSTHYFNPKAKSTCSILFSLLREKFKYNPPVFIPDLVKWADIIDSASFASAREAVEITKRNQPFGLAAFLDVIEKRHYKEVIKRLAEKPILEVIKLPYIQSWLKRRTRELKAAKEVLKKIAEPRGAAIFVDETKTRLDIPRYLAYFLYPKFDYVVTLGRYNNGLYYLGVGKNPWKKTPAKVHIGEILKKYGGGGHKTVGGMERKTKPEILKIAGEVIEYLNKHG